MKENRKKVIGNGLLFAAVLALTLYAVFHGQDISAIRSAIGDCDWRWLVPGIFCVAAFIWGESVILRLLLRSCGQRLGPFRCFLISSVGFFFSAVTPSAGGGQPMQVLFLRREKVPVAVSAVSLMVITITYKLVLVTVGMCLALFGRDFLRAHMEGAVFFFWLGLTLTVGWVVILVILVFHPHLARVLAEGALGLLERLHILRRNEARREKLLASMAQYSQSAAYIKSHMGLMAGVLTITFAQRFALFTVPWLVCRAFGFANGWGQITVLMAVIAISSDMLPLPGGMGAAEGLFLTVFASVFGTLTLPAMVVSRGIEFYCRLALSAVFTLIAAAMPGRRGNENEKQRVDS